MEPQKIEMVYDGQQSLKPATTSGKQVQLAYREAFKFDDKTPKAQLVTIESFNEMRQCLLDNNLMKSK